MEYSNVEIVAPVRQGGDMARNDDILNKTDPRDQKEYDALISKAYKAKRKIEIGFLELAESIFEIHQKKLYKLKYSSFGKFCEEELGFSRQTVYVYISILNLVNRFPQYLPREKAIDFGHKKMRYISEGVNAVETTFENSKKKKKLIVEIFNSIDPAMPSTEIESIITNIVAV